MNVIDAEDAILHELGPAFGANAIKAIEARGYDKAKMQLLRAHAEIKDLKDNQQSFGRQAEAAERNRIWLAAEDLLTEMASKGSSREDYRCSRSFFGLLRIRVEPR